MSFLAGAEADFISRVSRGKRFVKYWLPVLCWVALIFTASSDLGSTRHTSRIIGPLLRWLNPDISDKAIQSIQFVVRKTTHMVEYAVLTILLWWAFRKPVKNDPRPWRWSEGVWAVVVAILYAMTDEFHQSFVSTRQGQWSDVLIDAAGALGALALLWTAHRVRLRG